MGRLYPETRRGPQRSVTRAEKVYPLKKRAPLDARFFCSLSALNVLFEIFAGLEADGLGCLDLHGLAGLWVAAHACGTVLD